MKTINQRKLVEINHKSYFEALCQEFAGENFYGLEYVIDDFSPDKTPKSASLDRSAIDWFGLNE
jgi:hypothetical protein